MLNPGNDPWDELATLGELAVHPLARTRALRKDPEPFARSRVAQPVVERHEIVRTGTLSCPQEGSGELERVGSTKRVHREKTLRPFSKRVTR
jgi:hypothetical protein